MVQCMLMQLCSISTIFGEPKTVGFSLGDENLMGLDTWRASWEQLERAVSRYDASKCSVLGSEIL